jgi:Cof subfamily protein (haloacid dehalogenase superfamily)
MDDIRYSVVALDLDGTVLSSSGGPSQAFKEATLRLTALGVRTVLCTGRRWRSAWRVVQKIEHAHPRVVCCSGALIKNGETHQTLYSNALRFGVARHATEEFRAAGLVPFLLYDLALGEQELWIAEEDRKRAEGLSYVARNAESIRYYRGPLPRSKDRPLEVYTVAETDRMRLAEPTIRKHLGKEARVTMLSHPHKSTQSALEVHAPAATKWTALRWMLGRWGVPAERVVAIGDDVNDIPMLRAAGLSFAMANAVPAVVAICDRVTGSNDEDGVVQALGSIFPLSQGTAGSASC